MTQNVVGIRQPIITRRIAFFPSVRNPLLKNVRVRRRNSKKAEITLKKKIDRFYDNNLTTDGRITSNRLYIYKNSRDTFRSRVASSRFVNCVVPFIFFWNPTTTNDVKAISKSVYRRGRRIYCFSKFTSRITGVGDKTYSPSIITILSVLWPKH